MPDTDPDVRLLRAEVGRALARLISTRVALSRLQREGRIDDTVVRELLDAGLRAPETAG